MNEQHNNNDNTTAKSQYKISAKFSALLNQKLVFQKNANVDLNHNVNEESTFTSFVQKRSKETRTKSASKLKQKNDDDSEDGHQQKYNFKDYLKSIRLKQQSAPKILMNRNRTSDFNSIDVVSYLSGDDEQSTNDFLQEFIKRKIFCKPVQIAPNDITIDNRLFSEPIYDQEALGAYVTQDQSILNAQKDPSTKSTTQSPSEIELRNEPSNKIHRFKTHLTSIKTQQKSTQIISNENIDNKVANEEQLLQNFIKRKIFKTPKYIKHETIKKQFVLPNKSYNIAFHNIDRVLQDIIEDNIDLDTFIERRLKKHSPISDTKTDTKDIAPLPQTNLITSLNIDTDLNLDSSFDDFVSRRVKKQQLHFSFEEKMTEFTNLQHEIISLIKEKYKKLTTYAEFQRLVEQIEDAQTKLLNLPATYKNIHNTSNHTVEETSSNENTDEQMQDEINTTEITTTQLKDNLIETADLTPENDQEIMSFIEKRLKKKIIVNQIQSAQETINNLDEHLPINSVDNLELVNFINKKIQKKSTKNLATRHIESQSEGNATTLDNTPSDNNFNTQPLATEPHTENTDSNNSKPLPMHIETDDTPAISTTNSSVDPEEEDTHSTANHQDEPIEMNNHMTHNISTIFDVTSFIQNLNK